MEILGPRDPGRPQANRTGEAERRGHRSSRPGGSAGSIDRLEPGDSVLIDQAVREVSRQLDRSAGEVRARREELLARSEDPEAIHRAARGLIRGGFVSANDLA